MALLRKRHPKLGMPPGSIVYVGDEITEPVALTLMAYDAETLTEDTASSFEEIEHALGDERPFWLNVEGVHSVDILQRLGTHFSIHPLVLEDIANTTQRPKLEVHDEYLFLVARMLSLGTDGEVESEQVSFIIGNRYVLTFQEQAGDVFDTIRQRLRQTSGRIRQRGPDYLAYALLDVIVDHYFLVLEKVDDIIEELEETVISRPGLDVRRQLNRQRRELVTVRRAVWPMRETLLGLNREETPYIRPETEVYLRDTYDHAVQVVEIVESLREMLSSLHDLYMSSLSNRMNEVMKTLTIIGTIFIPLTFLAGVYGMNFEYMPELEYRYGYFITLAGMGLIGGLLLLYFKRRNWF